MHIPDITIAQVVYVDIETKKLNFTTTTIIGVIGITDYYTIKSIFKP